MKFKIKGLDEEVEEIKYLELTRDGAYVNLKVDGHTIAWFGSNNQMVLCTQSRYNQAGIELDKSQ